VTGTRSTQPAPTIVIFGATGDLILVPDGKTEVKVDFGPDSAPEHFYLGDIRETDGRPWACCPREFLRRALADLKAVAGLQLNSAFEQEFVAVLVRHQRRIVEQAEFLFDLQRRGAEIPGGRAQADRPYAGDLFEGVGGAEH